MVRQRKTNRELSLGEAFANMGDKLKQTAYLPNMHRYEPHLKQQLFHESQKKGRLFIGGNRTGKTVSNVMECIWWLTKTHPYREMPKEPVRGRFVTVDFKNIIKPVTIPMFKQWLPQSYLFNGSWEDSYDKQTDTLHLTNGSFIEFMSYEQETDKFASASRHFVSFDEEPPKDIWQECLARLIDTNGSWWMSMTPLFGMTWVHSQVFAPAKNNPEHPFLVVQADMADNHHLPPESRDAYLATLSDDERKARDKGEFVQLGGKVYQAFKPAIHEMRQQDFHLTSDMRIYTSVDGGWAHPAGWLWHAVTPAGEVITFYEQRSSFVTIKGWAERVISFERTLRYEDTGRRVQVFMRTGDPALRQTRPNTGISDLAEYAKHGIYLAVEGVPAGPGSVDVGLKKLESYFAVNPKTGRPTWRYTDNCHQLKDEMMKYHWETWASKRLEEKNAPKATVHKVEDDLCDSLRYFVSTMPELSFDGSVQTPYVTDRLGAVTDMPVPLIDTPDIGRERDYKDYGSLESVSGYILHDEHSAWEMEW